MLCCYTADLSDGTDKPGHGLFGGWERLRGGLGLDPAGMDGNGDKQVLAGWCEEK